MAEQARKFGGRVREIRDERRWKQRDLVARMAELGDQALNTNQLSRYENGGAMPSEQRQVWFAEALETTVADLHSGPLAERAEPTRAPDVLASLEPDGARLARIEAKLDRIITALGLDQVDDPAGDDLLSAAEAPSAKLAARESVAHHGVARDRSSRRSA